MPAIRPSVSMPLALLLGVSLVSCTNGPRQTGAVHLSASVQDSLITLSAIEITVTGPGIPVNAPIVQNLSQLNNVTWQGLLAALPTGLDTFSAKAYDTSEPPQVVFTGSAQKEVVAGATAFVAIVLNQTNPGPPYQDSAPVLDAVTASTDQPFEGEAVALQVFAHDPDEGDPLTYAWSSPKGSFGDTAGSASATWIVPTIDGPVDITIAVSDSHHETVSLTFTLTVGPSAGSAQVTVYVNYTPSIQSITAEPGQIGLGGTTFLSLDVSNADGDSLTYLWTVFGCAGDFNDATAAEPSFTFTGYGDGNICELHVVITDGHGASTSGSITISDQLPVLEIAPQITSTTATEQGASGNQQLSFGLAASDPQDSALTFAWTASLGTLASDTGTGDATHSQNTLTAPACIPPEGIIVLATVTDEFALSTTQRFNLAPASGAACPGFQLITTNYALATHFVVSRVDVASGALTDLASTSAFVSYSTPFLGNDRETLYAFGVDAQHQSVAELGTVDTEHPPTGSSTNLGAVSLSLCGMDALGRLFATDGQSVMELIGSPPEVTVIPLAALPTSIYECRIDRLHHRLLALGIQGDSDDPPVTPFLIAFDLDTIVWGQSTPLAEPSNQPPSYNFAGVTTDGRAVLTRRDPFAPQYTAEVVNADGTSTSAGVIEGLTQVESATFDAASGTVYVLGNFPVTLFEFDLATATTTAVPFGGSSPTEYYLAGY